MSIAYLLSLYIDGEMPGGANAVLDGKTSNPPSVAQRWMQGDKASLKVFFRKRGEAGAASTPLELASGFSLVVSGKLKTALSAGVELFHLDGLTVNGTTDDLGYMGALDLGTDAIAAAFESESKDELTLAVDIEYRDGGNTLRLTYRAEVILCREAYQGAEVSPVPSQTYRMISAGGIVWQLSITDDGQIQRERV